MSLNAQLLESPSRSQRVLRHPLTRIVIALIFITVTVLLLQTAAAISHFKPNGAVRSATAAVLTIVALLGTYSVYVRLVEHRSATELAATRAAPDCAIGFLLGGSLFSFVMLILWLMGVATIGNGAGLAAAWTALMSAFELAVLQAILVYGILFRLLEERFGTLIPVIVTVVVLSALHAASPGATLISEITIGLEVGILFAAVYVYSRGLWMPIGLFSAWNFLEDGVFGISIPGHTEAGLLISRFAGPQLLTGGAAGPEVSVVALLVCLAAAAWIFRRVSRPAFRRDIQ